MVKSTWLGTAALGSIGLVLVLQGVSDQAFADAFLASDRVQTVADRRAAEHSSSGLALGDFIVSPRLDVAQGFMTNLYGLSGVPAALGLDGVEDEAGTYSTLRASLALKSRWARHALSVGGFVGGQFADYNESHFHAESGGYISTQLDMSRHAALFAAASYENRTESLRDINSALITLNPIRYEQSKFRVGITQRLGDFAYRAEATMVDLNVDDAVSVLLPNIEFSPDGDQDFRDHQGYEALLKAYVHFTDHIALTFAGTYNFQDYDEDAEAAFFDRDSEGWDLKLGAQAQFSRYLKGDVAVGAFEQRYEDDRFAKAYGTSYDATLVLAPRSGTSLSLMAKRGLQESRVRPLAGVVVTEGSLRVEQDLNDRVLGYVTGGYGVMEYPDLVGIEDMTVLAGLDPTADQDVDRVRVGAGVIFYPSEHVEASLNYAFEAQNAQNDFFDGGASKDYQLHQVLVTVTVK